MRSFLVGNDLAPVCSRGLRRFLLATHALHGFLHVGRRDVPNMSGDRPAMAKRILDLAVAVTPKHVSNGHRCLCSSPDGPRGNRIDIIDEEVDGDGGALEAFFCSTVRVLLTVS